MTADTAVVRTLAGSRRWMAQGTQLIADAIAILDETAYADGTGLPDWSRKHVVAHLAANAEAIGNLVHWAASGERTPMYSSTDQRAADIETGSRLSATDLSAWFTRSAATLGSAMDALTESHWATEVVTAQGRTVPASETPWMRAREVMVHAVDLGTGLTFTDLPADFLAALIVDIRIKRGEVPEIDGPLADQAAWLAGRPHSLTNAPTLGPWL
jgi:maleylpyruvate isomerase